MDYHLLVRLQGLGEEEANCAFEERCLEKVCLFPSNQATFTPSPRSLKTVLSVLGYCLSILYLEAVYTLPISFPVYTYSHLPLRSEYM